MTLTNQSDQPLDAWALSFTSAYRFSGDLYRYQLSGADWGQSIGAGESRTVGFNALTGTDLARDGALSEDILLAAGTEIAVP